MTSHGAHANDEVVQGVESSAAETELVLVVLRMLNFWRCKKAAGFPAMSLSKTKYAQAQIEAARGDSNSRHERKRGIIISTGYFLYQIIFGSVSPFGQRNLRLYCPTAFLVL